MVRLDKYLANANVGTRSEVKSLIKKGEVTVDGIRVTDGAKKIEESSTIICQGKEINPLANCVYMLNKPEGYVSATTDDRDKTIVDLLAAEGRDDIFPIGRLDKDTEGVILLTNDGALSHSLLSPRKHVNKTYLCVVDKELSEDEIISMEQGVDIGDDKPTGPASLQVISLEDAVREYRIGIGNVDDLFSRITNLQNYTPQDVYAYLLTISEGRFHQVKRMFMHFRSEVIYLNRVEFAGIKLDMDMELGEYRELSYEEVKNLSQSNYTFG